MKVPQTQFVMEDIEYIIRSATEKDARYLSILRLQIDGETEYLDRESGEARFTDTNTKFYFVMGRLSN